MISIGYRTNLLPQRNSGTATGGEWAESEARGNHGLLSTGRGIGIHPAESTSIFVVSFAVIQVAPVVRAHGLGLSIVAAIVRRPSRDRMLCASSVGFGSCLL